MWDVKRTILVDELQDVSIDSFFSDEMPDGLIRIDAFIC